VKIFIILLISLTFVIQVSASDFDSLYKDYQFRGIEFTPNPENLKKYNRNMPLWVPFLESVAFNTLLTSFNRYVLKRDLSHLTLKSVKKNFTHGLDWDTDAMSTNFFLHPVQGSIYYNTARANGFSMEKSYLMSLLGSLQWEYFMEVLPPSINDLVITSISGSFLGEIFYQITSLILDDSRLGFIRYGKEISAGLIAPGRFFSRTVNGSLWNHNTYNLYAKRKYKLSMGLGVNNLSDKNSFSNFNTYPEFIFNLNFIHGNPFLVKKLKILRFFKFNLLLKTIKSNQQQFLTSFNADGILFGRHYNKNKHDFILSFNQYFNYFNTEIYQIGALKFGPTIRYRSPDSSVFGIDSSLAISFIPMAGILSSYSQYHLVEEINESKVYNTSWGGSIDYSLELLTKYISFKFDYIFWVLRTYNQNGAGALGTEISSMIKPSIRINFSKKINLKLELLTYVNRAKYDLYPDTKRYLNEVRIILNYNF